MKQPFQIHSMKNNIIPIGCDHAGFEYKQPIIDFLVEKGFEVNDMGTFSVESADYPDFAHPVAQAVNDGEYAFGILLCGSGQGVCMVANKYPSVRAALVWESAIAQFARTHNNANIICLPARFISKYQAIEFVHVFLTTNFEVGRHKRRIDKIGR